MQHRHETLSPSLLIGLDVGGTKIDAMVVDQTQQIRGAVTLSTRCGTADQVVESVTQAIHHVLADANVTLHQVAAVGIGIPGQVTDGIVDLAVNLSLYHYPLGSVLESTLNVPVHLENDVRAAAVGAYETLHAGETVTSLAYLSVGTGLSAGIVLDGTLRRGDNNMAGEIGHVIIEPGGADCNCGARGCLETICSGPGIARQAAEAVAAGHDTLLTEIQAPESPDVYAAARAGDTIAQQIVRKTSMYLGSAIQWLVLAYDVDRVVLGGGVSREGDDFLQPVLDELRRLRPTSPLNTTLFPEEKVMLQPADVNAGLWGIISLAARHRIPDGEPGKEEQLVQELDSVVSE